MLGFVLEVLRLLQGTQLRCIAVLFIWAVLILITVKRRKKQSRRLKPKHKRQQLHRQTRRLLPQQHQIQRQLQAQQTRIQLLIQGLNQEIVQRPQPPLHLQRRLLQARVEPLQRLHQVDQGMIFKRRFFFFFALLLFFSVGALSSFAKDTFSLEVHGVLAKSDASQKSESQKKTSSESEQIESSEQDHKDLGDRMVEFIRSILEDKPAPLDETLIRDEV